MLKDEHTEIKNKPQVTTCVKVLQKHEAIIRENNLLSSKIISEYYIH